MIVLIRADANSEIGSGHVMRCAALGMRLMKYGANVYFVCIDLPNELVDWLRKRDFNVYVISNIEPGDWQADLKAISNIVQNIGQIDLLIVDHYGLDKNWESGMRPHVRRILVVDDLANRDHDCDMLLDQNLHENPKARYSNHVSSSTRLFLGPRYAILRDEFDDTRLVRNRDGSVRSLLVFLGGDLHNHLLVVVSALRRLGPLLPKVIVVLGFAHPYRDIIIEHAYDLPGVEVLETTNNMANLIAQSDLVIGTCGVSAWERCVFGVPSIVVVTAENQREDAEILHSLGAVEYLGDADNVSVEQWEATLRRIIQDPECICSMSVAANGVMLGREVAQREIEKELINGIF